MSTTARKARKRAGIPFVRTPKVPTPVLERSHTWLNRSHLNQKSGRIIHQIKPSQLAIRRSYGIRDLGWQEPKVYLTARGKLARRAEGL